MKYMIDARLGAILLASFAAGCGKGTVTAERIPSCVDTDGMTDQMSIWQVMLGPQFPEQQSVLTVHAPPSGAHSTPRRAARMVVR